MSFPINEVVARHRSFGQTRKVLYPEDYLDELPDQPPPSSATRVRDLIALVADNQRVTFRGRASGSEIEQTFFKVSEMGGYINHGLPMIIPQPDALRWPTPKRRDWSYRSLASLGDYHIKHPGPAEWMADLYRIGTAIFLVSDKLLRVIKERDPEAVETRRATIVGPHASDIRPYSLVMPLRVLDAVDISKSSVWLKRPETVRGSGKFVTHVSYEKGYVFRDDLPRDVSCFFEEFGDNAGWYWHRDLIEAAADAGVRGVNFGLGQVDGSRVRKLRGPNDPPSW